MAVEWSYDPTQADLLRPSSALLPVPSRGSALVCPRPTVCPLFLFGDPRSQASEPPLPRGRGLGLGSKLGVLQEASSLPPSPLQMQTADPAVSGLDAWGVQVVKKRWRRPFLITTSLPLGSCYVKGPVLVYHEPASHSSKQSEAGKPEIKRDPGGEAGGQG